MRKAFRHGISNWKQFCSSKINSFCPIRVWTIIWSSFNLTINFLKTLWKENTCHHNHFCPSPCDTCSNQIQRSLFQYCKEFADIYVETKYSTSQIKFPRYSYLNLGCLLMASSGKKRDFEAPSSTGVGLYSGSVNPGHPNLCNTTMRSKL